MKRLDGEKESQIWLKAAIYGKPGTGKTSFGVSAPKPLILLSEPQGFVHVQQAAQRLGVPVPPTFLVESVEDYRCWLRALHGDRAQPLRLKERHRNPADGKIEEILVLELPEWPETVVIDSLTDAGRLIVQEIRAMSPQKPGPDGLPVDSQRFWNVLADKFQALIHNFRALPMHVIFLALADDRVEGEGDARQRDVTMDLPMRKLPAIVSSAVNVVAYTYRREVHALDQPTELIYGVHTVGPESFTLKPLRPLRDTEVPDFSQWVAMVRGQLRELPPPPQPSAESALSVVDAGDPSGQKVKKEKVRKTAKKGRKQNAQDGTERQ